jgi:hypothetical protein
MKRTMRRWAGWICCLLLLGGWITPVWAKAPASAGELGIVKAMGGRECDHYSGEWCGNRDECRVTWSNGISWTCGGSQCGTSDTAGPSHHDQCKDVVYSYTACNEGSGWCYEYYNCTCEAGALFSCIPHLYGDKQTGGTRTWC